MFAPRGFLLPARNRSGWLSLSTAMQGSPCKMAVKLLLRNLNIFPDRHAGPHWFSKWLLAGLAVTCLVYDAQGSRTNSAMSDYVRDRWGIEQGFPGGPVYAIAQTPDGYLWIGTEKGLVRF